MLWRVDREIDSERCPGESAHVMRANYPSVGKCIEIAALQAAKKSTLVIHNLDVD
eukprot:CAMPEP_0194751432 /NCGR_PEP_ID=MMETSP0323_2-20130528/5492_1 /TAXON_ID=2866 ORGANISM="Crypthecodinium cohnii, Strain Seligo" /NCGR_SAMPLE_ID=MMETSP0323_2 /ASSEMBLY_ACC=CAM_ASM_000346 /LENGTH=54 /DNA_ID=CAMNT_0039667929 /DNA_START=233 /DNA_END=394 /DNA_ORIENTATION=-